MILFRSRTFPGVQSTRPRARTRHDFQLFKLLNQSFNPCVLAGGRDHTPRYRKSHKLFQSTRPHGRTRQINHDKLEAIKVSIHASSREDATFLFMASPFLSVFQSTHPHGRTRQMRTHNGRESIGFNPRVLTGGRDKIFQLPAIFELFQSTRPHGRTRPVPIYNINPGASRVLTGGRDSRRIVRTEPQRGFNPRVLTGGRDFYAQLSFELQVFQSTRPHGRTRLAFILSWYILPVSIHGPHGRTRLPIHCIRHCCHVSIHASSREDAT